MAESILIATLGTEPQVVTATLDLLLRVGTRITRLTVLHSASEGLPAGAAVEQLQSEFSRHPKEPPSVRFVPLRAVDRLPVLDVVTTREIDAVFRTLYQEVAEAKRQGRHVHLSIAGGRKTMAVFGMVVAELLFEPADHLWHLHSAGDFLESRRLHPNPHDDVRLVRVPVVPWSALSPVYLGLTATDDPYEALERQRMLHLRERLDQAMRFLHEILSPAERSVVVLAARDGLSDAQIARALILSPKTVGHHLSSAYAKARDMLKTDAVNRQTLAAWLGFVFSLIDPDGSEAPRGSLEDGEVSR